MGGKEPINEVVGSLTSGSFDSNFSTALTYDLSGGTFTFDVSSNPPTSYSTDYQEAWMTAELPDDYYVKEGPLNDISFTFHTYDLNSFNQPYPGDYYDFQRSYFYAGDGFTQLFSSDVISTPRIVLDWKAIQDGTGFPGADNLITGVEFRYRISHSPSSEDFFVEFLFDEDTIEIFNGQGPYDINLNMENAILTITINGTTLVSLDMNQGDIDWTTYYSQTGDFENYFEFISENRPTAYIRYFYTNGELGSLPWRYFTTTITDYQGF